MTYHEMFEKVKAMLADVDVSGVGEHLAFQFNVTGEAAGAFYMEVKDGTLHVEPYTYNDRYAAFTLSADTLFKIAARKMDPILAVTLGKLKVEGNITKALKIKDFLK